MAASVSILVWRGAIIAFMMSIGGIGYSYISIVETWIGVSSGGTVGFVLIASLHTPIENYFCCLQHCPAAKISVLTG
jgi:hypothetical protein